MRTKLSEELKKKRKDRDNYIRLRKNFYENIYTDKENQINKNRIEVEKNRLKEKKMFKKKIKSMQKNKEMKRKKERIPKN